jgi:hypothetical protein
MTRTVRLLLISMAFALALPGLARAQSAITGVVRDSSGAVLPGVTVEASSEALIEKTRAVVTDGEGVYRIVDLRPGMYVVTFQLTGFSTLRREGLELPGEFTMTINAQLSVGALEESITVSGDAPIVDVSSTVHTQVMNRDTLDSLPTGRTIQGLGQLVVGVALNIPDVGGSRAMQQTYMTTHGMTTANTTILVDGQMVNGLQADGAVQSYFNDAMSQEVSYQTSGIGAETSAGGVRLNMIPREGGNRFSGSFFSTWKDGAWQGDNFTQEVRDRGLTSPSAIDRIYDFNFSQGGPIKKDKLWFFGSARAWSVDAPIANTQYPGGTANCSERGGVLGTNASGVEICQGLDDQLIKSALLRVTYQISPRNKLSAYFDEIDKYRGHAMSTGDDPETASVVWNSPAYHTGAMKFTSTVTSRLLLELGASNNTENYTNEYQEGISKTRFTPEWYASAPRRNIDLATRWGAPEAAIITQSPVRFAASAAVSYVTGSHNLKFGIQDTWGRFVHTRDQNADVQQVYRTSTVGGVQVTRPDSVVVRNTPYESRENLNYDVGIYAQDQWTLKRLTINAGLRWEWLNAGIPEQTSPAGRISPARSYPEYKNLPDWSDPAPRFGIVYDLFGNGKTAVKASLNRYNLARTTGVADIYNPLRNATQSLAWNDLNGDDIAQGERGCTFMTPGCEINFAGLSPNFGIAALSTYDPETKRTWNLEQGYEVQHEIMSRLSGTFSMYRGSFKNLTQSDNLAVTRADWIPLNVFNPMDGTPLTIYTFNRAQKPAINNFDTTAPGRERTYESYGFQLNARLPRGASLFGGMGWERNQENWCDTAYVDDDPNLGRFCDDGNLPNDYRIPLRFGAKLSGSWTFPYEVQVSATFQSNPGNVDLTNTVVRIPTTVGDQSGSAYWLLSPTTRYPADCPAPCPAGQLVLAGMPFNGAVGNNNLNVPLIPYGADTDVSYLDRINQLDLRFTKTFNFGRVRVLPQLDIYNVFNSSAVILYRSASYATATYHSAAGILNGRIIGLGAQMRW